MDFLLKSVNEVQSLDWSASHYEVWIKVFSVLLVLQSEDCGSGIDLSLLSNIVQRLTDEENLMHVWKEIILKPKCATSRDCFEVLNGFRVIANVYKDNVPASLTMREYSCAMMRALARCVACTKKSGNGETIAMILSLLSNSNLKYFLMELTQNPDSELSNIFAAANPIWCLNAASICIKAMEESDVTGWSAFERVFKALMQKVSENGIPISEVLEALVFNKAAPISTYGATLIISTFTVVELPEVLDTVGLVWGDRQFVSRADDKKQLLYTRILLAALTRCERRHLQANGSRNLPVELVLTMGVSNYLEIENIRIRQYGMKVAVAYSKLLGQELHFAELEAIERAEEERNTQLSANPGVAQVEAQAQVQVGGTTAGASAGERKHSSGMSAQVTGGGETGTGRRGSAQPQSAGYDSDGDSDSSVELEGYAIDEGAGAQGSGSVYSYKDKLLRTNYLRDCLQSKQAYF